MHPNRFAYRHRFSATAAALVVVGGSILTAAVPAMAATPKKGAACTKAQVGKVSTTLVCAKVGAKYRWQAAAAATAVSPTTPVIAATPTAAASIGADVLSTAIDGTLVVIPFLDKVTGKTFNQDGRCSIVALLTYFTGCGGTVTLNGSATAYTWRVIGQGGTEYNLYSAKLPTATKVGDMSWWVQPFPNELHVMWKVTTREPPKLAGPISAFYLQLLTTDRSPFNADPALIDRLVRVAAVIEAPVFNLP